MNFANSNRWFAGNPSQAKRYICEKPDACHNPENPCQNSGTCNIELTDGPDAYACTCTEFYTSANCETDINECAIPDFCNNGFDCACHTGYTGARCADDINECESQPGPCMSDATCENIPGSYKCHCMAGYTGVHCKTDIPECASNPCGNDGTCIEQINGYECNCTEYFNGTHCDVDVNECETENHCGNMTCTNTIGGYKCECPHLYEELQCTDNFDPCLNETACDVTHDCSERFYGKYVCVRCNEGYNASAQCTIAKIAGDINDDKDDDLTTLRMLFKVSGSLLAISLFVLILLVIDDRIYQRRLNAAKRQRALRDDTDTSPSSDNKGNKF